MRQKTYAQFLYQCFVYETDEVEVNTRNPAEVNIPSGYVAVRFFDRSVVVVEGEVLMGAPKNFSNWYYKGEEISSEELRKIIPPEEEEILDKYISQGINRFVRTNQGVLPLREGMEVIPAT